MIGKISALVWALAGIIWHCISTTCPPLWHFINALCPPPWLGAFAACLVGLVGGYIERIGVAECILIATLAASVLGSQWLARLLFPVPPLPEKQQPPLLTGLGYVIAYLTAVICEYLLVMALACIAWQAWCFCRMVEGAVLIFLYWLGRCMWGEPRWGANLQLSQLIFLDRFNRGVYLARRDNRCLYPFKNWVCSRRARPRVWPSQALSEVWALVCPCYRQLWYNPIFRPLQLILSLLVTGPYRLRRQFYLRIWVPGWHWLLNTEVYQHLIVHFTLYRIRKWGEISRTSLIYPARILQEFCEDVQDITAYYMWHRNPKSPLWLCPLLPGSPISHNPLSLLLRLIWRPFPWRWETRFGYYGLWYHPENAAARELAYAACHVPLEVRQGISDQLAWANPAPAARSLFARLPQRLQAALSGVAAHPVWAPLRAVAGLLPYLWHRPPALPDFAARYLRPARRGGGELPLWATLPLRPWEGTRLSRHPAAQAAWRFIAGAVKCYLWLSPWIRLLISIYVSFALGLHAGVGLNIPPLLSEVRAKQRPRRWDPFIRPEDDVENIWLELLLYIIVR